MERLHEEHGGATFSLYIGNVVGQELFAVSLYPERSRRTRGKGLTEERLRAFLAENEDLLRDPRNAVGTWYNEEYDMTYLDISATLPDREQTLALGRQYDQIGIYDLRRGEEISVGGAGGMPGDLPPEGVRLPRPIR